MSWIIYKNHIQTQEMTHQKGEQHATVFAVVLLIVVVFLAEKHHSVWPPSPTGN